MNFLTSFLTGTKYIKDHVIHYDQTHREFVGYKNVSCQTTKSKRARFQVEDLYKGFNYTYRIGVYNNRSFVGNLYEGMFVGTGYVPIVVVVEDIVSPLGVYLLTCAALVFILLVSFVFSIAVGWDRVVNDVAVRKDKLRKMKEAEMGDKTGGRLLTEGFINNQTQDPFPSVFS